MHENFKLNFGQEYKLQYEWPDCHLQGNTCGVVLSKGTPYSTAFFEAFPLDTFIRGEGETVKEAETQAWKKYQRILKCEKHEYERISDSGRGRCIKCGVTHSDVLPCIQSCSVCGKVNVGFFSKDDNHICLEHFMEITNDYTELTENDFNPDADSFDDKHAYAFCLSYRYQYEALKESNLIPKEIGDYELFKFIEKYFEMFVQYVQNYLLLAVKAQSCDLKLMESIVISTNLPFYQDVYKNLLKEYINRYDDLEEFSDEHYSKTDLQNELFKIYENKKNEKCS